jgi:hypothetical protein
MIAWSCVADRARPDGSGAVLVVNAERHGHPEVLPVGGRTYRSAGEVLDVHPGSRFTRRTTPGADVDTDGSRTVDSPGPEHCRVRPATRVRPGNVQRFLAPALRGMLRRGPAADAQRLPALAEAAPDRR